MADMQTFPKTFKEFVKQYEFEDKEGIYTNNSMLIPSFRVIQAWEHYTEDLSYAINSMYDCANIISNNLFDMEEILDEV